MQIVEMEPRHVEQVAALERICFSDPWSAASIASELDHPLSYWLVAEENAQVVGYIGSQSVQELSDMMNVAVAPAWRRRGLGRRLVQALLAHLLQTDAAELSLEVRVSNAAAIALYEQLGFQIVGCRKRYYVNPREDAYIMRKQWKELAF